MPRKKKTAQDMTNEELAKKIFPKKLRDKLNEIAHENAEKQGDKNDDKE